MMLFYKIILFLGALFLAYLLVDKKYPTVDFYYSPDITHELSIEELTYLDKIKNEMMGKFIDKFLLKDYRWGACIIGLYANLDVLQEYSIGISNVSTSSTYNPTWLVVNREKNTYHVFYSIDLKALKNATVNVGCDTETP